MNKKTAKHFIIFIGYMKENHRDILDEFLDHYKDESEFLYNMETLFDAAEYDLLDKR